MSINGFFLLVLTLLVGMFGYFKPQVRVEYLTHEVPQFELDQFVIYEINRAKIDRFFEGGHGKHFEDRYEISDAKFTNNSKTMFESIRADKALYKENLISLDGDVHYVREDGFQFRSSEGTYDQNSSRIQTKGAFVLTKDGNKVDGRHLDYNVNLDTVSADKVRGSYQLN
ncbi:MAG: LPS export ABC transporter periplasmic protein LptC [Campylobacterales bacterium]|nr:LPS export ABC transporter periplasmic protein LptC [Campylobacterales bacterium]